MLIHLYRSGSFIVDNLGPFIVDNLEPSQSGTYASQFIPKHKSEAHEEQVAQIWLPPLDLQTPPWQATPASQC